MKRSSTGSLLLATLWAASIFATSSGVVTVGQLSRAVSTAAGGHISESGFRHFWGVAWWIFVKGWHAAEFGILFLLIRRVFPDRIRIAAALAGAFAISDEFHQLFVPTRGCRFSDVCIDWLGIAAAWSFASGWMRAKARRPWILAAIVCGWVCLVFLLSVYPFGLVTLGQATPTRPDHDARVALIQLGALLIRNNGTEAAAAGAIGNSAETALPQKLIRNCGMVAATTDSGTGAGRSCHRRFLVYLDHKLGHSAQKGRRVGQPRAKISAATTAERLR